MATLRLFWVQCNDQQESGSDEIQFRFLDTNDGGRGSTNVITSMDDGDRFQPMTDRFTSDGAVVVSLYEVDAASNPDDYIDSVTLRFDPSEAGENKTAVFQGNGAEYLLRYDIIA